MHDRVSRRNEEKTYLTHFFPYSVYFKNFLRQQSEKYPYSDSINIINPHGSISSKNSMIYVEELVILKKEEISRRSINTDIDI